MGRHHRAGTNAEGDRGAARAGNARDHARATGREAAHGAAGHAICARARSARRSHPQGPRQMGGRDQERRHQGGVKRMYSLHLSPEQLQVRDTVRDFVAREIKPLALAPARLEASARPVVLEALEKASQIGLRTLALSEEKGGAGADSLTCCLVTEELAVGDADIAAVLADTSTLAGTLFDSLMTPEQRARFLPAFLAE